MKKKRIKNAPVLPEGESKERIAKMHSRASTIGLIYAAVLLFISVCALFPLIEAEYAYPGILYFWKPFTLQNMKDIQTGENLMPFINSVFYTSLLVILVWNLVKGGIRVGWLLNKKQSKAYGFNRSVYAMHDLGNAFSDAFFAIIGFHFLICLLCGQVTFKPLVFVVLAVGVATHFLCGHHGGKASYFEVNEEGEAVEHKRLFDRFAPFIRNLLQIVATFVMMYFFVEVCNVGACIRPFYDNHGVKEFLLDGFLAYASLILQTMTAVSLMVLLRHAVGIAEYDIEGPNATGMKNYRVFVFFVMLTSGATFICRAVFGEAIFLTGADGGHFVTIEYWQDWDSLLLAAIALAMFVIEIVMRNMPFKKKRIADDKKEDVETVHAVAEEEKTEPLSAEKEKDLQTE